jgi:hypothetical protein
VCWPAAISCQPPACGSVGPAGNRRSNQARTAGWNESSTCSPYLRLPTFRPMSAALAAVQPIAGGDHFASALPAAVAVLIYRLTTST